MLISEFCRFTGLSADTVRFYIRRGLLDPVTGAKGGRNPYQLFTAEHVRTARLIRMGQALGLSLKEIAALNDEHRAGSVTREQSIALMETQLARLEARKAELDALASYARARLAWLHDGERGPEPSFPDFVPGAPFGD